MTVGTRIIALRPRRMWAPPGRTIVIDLDIAAASATDATLVVELLDVAEPVVRLERRLRLRAGRSRRTTRVRLPARLRAGYGLRATLAPTSGRVTSRETAVEAIDGWWQAPRHAAIVDHADRERAISTVRALRDWHVNVVQLYDWMYRHYRYRPPAGTTFIDPLGQHVSHDAVRAGVRAGHAVGIASLAYGSVYGAEREYVDAHPDERVFDPDGRPLSLGETFYINDLRSGRPWRTRLLAEYRSAVRSFRVDGIHMDTYGPPHHAVGADGGSVDFAAEYPGLIAEAARVVDAASPGARVLFNCVDGFPLESIAPAPTAALYLELWPPDAAYVDIVAWIERAAMVAGDRAVIIAAYLSVLRANEHDPVGRSEALEAAALLSSIVFAAGAYHHVLAGGDRLLVEGYYPEARHLRPSERETIRAAWSFQARYRHLLADPGRVPVTALGVAILDRGGRPVPLSANPTPGSVWIRATTTSRGQTVVHLIDLLDQDNGAWDARRQPSPRRLGWRLITADNGGARRRTWAMSPWTRRGAPQPVHHGQLPPVRRWLVVCTDDESADRGT